MKIAFLVFSPHGDALVEPDWCEYHPLGGSETAAVRLASALRNLGQDVTVLTHPSQLVGKTWDVFVSLRIWNVFEAGLSPGFLNYLWCQDDFDQPQVQDLQDPVRAQKVYDACDGVILLSHYQRNQFTKHLHLPLGKVFLTTNGIPRGLFTASPEGLSARAPWAFYASTPFRGLELLLDVGPMMVQAVPSAQLHVFSSMKVYNSPDTEYEKLYTAAKQLPGVNYHGSVGQARLREVAQRCRVLAYPCIFPETSCIVAMEAMAAGCVVVSTALGALPETAFQNPLVPLENDWIGIWAAAVVKALVDDRSYAPLAQQNLIVSRCYDWRVVATRWLNRFQTDYCAKRQERR